MIGFELDVDGPTLVRFVKTLGQHRYCASRLHLAHAFAVDAAGDLGEASDWARRALGGTLDVGSKDERLYRKVSDAELVAILDAFWGSSRGHDRLRAHLDGIGVTPGSTPFDEGAEDDVFPVLVDAGWELLPLAKLERERHRGAIDAFDDFEVARFEEESAIPPLVTLHELPTLGPTELLAAYDEEGKLRAPFVLWQEGHETYLDYVLRGVLRAAKIDVATS